MLETNYSYNIIIGYYNYNMVFSERKLYLSTVREQFIDGLQS